MSLKPSSQSIKYLALGDSYTIGTEVEETERFPAQTAKMLQQENIDVTELQYIAVRGWTTNNLMDGIRTENPSSDFDIVTLLIGVNDQYDGLSIIEYEKNFALLLAQAVEFAGGRHSRVFVLSIPDYSVVPIIADSDKERVSKEVDEFNARKKEITLQNGIEYIDITPGTRAAAMDLSLVANDKLHPSGKEYIKWAEKLSAIIISKLKESKSV